MFFSLHLPEQLALLSASCVPPCFAVALTLPTTHYDDLAPLVVTFSPTVCSVSCYVPCPAPDSATRGPPRSNNTVPWVRVRAAAAATCAGG